MRTASTRTVIAATLLGGSMSVWGLGMGPARVTAVLGQSLDALVPLHEEAGEPVPLECIEAKVFFGEDRLPGNQVRLRLDAAPAAPGERLLRISTTTLVNEPVVSLRVSAGCGAAVAREFVAFADPPTTQKAPPLPAPAVLSQAVPSPEPSRAAAATEGRPAAKATRQADARLPARHAAASSEPAARPRTAQAGTSATAGRAASTSRPEPAPRLQLDPLMPASPATTGDADVALAGAAGSASSRTTAETARLQALEATLAEVRSEMALTRRTLEGLEARARAAEQDRDRNSMIYALATLGAALSAALGWLLLERRRERKAAAWGEGLVVAQASLPLLQPERLEPAPEEHRLRSGAGSASPSAPEPAKDFAPQAAPDATSLPPDARLPAKRYGVLEELLDLDQQAAFLVALGQEQAAIGLLQEHIDRNASTSPLPWLELLALHQRRGERAAFDAVGKRFAERFDTLQPAWGTQLQQGCALEDYQAVIERLEWLWHSPDEIAALLEVLLLNSGGMDNMPDLPACQDLLLLYALVRERLGNEAVAASLDAELPWSFCQVERPRHAARGLEPEAPPVREMPPMPWPGENLRLPPDFGAQIEPSAAPARLDLDEPLPLLDFEPLQFEPVDLATADGGRS